MNIKPKTDFPDIRKVFVVHSTHGTIMGVPRENKLVRLYISMDSGNRSLALDGKELNADNILKAAQTILAPYTLEAASIPWWSAYCVGQRVADEFSRHDRIFLAGDAVHTHSPKAGQGMNTSIQDGYNIGWKLRYCLEQKGNSSILSTYEDERRPIAKALIDFDRKYLQFFARTDVTHNEFLTAYLSGLKFTTGIGIKYRSSMIVKDCEATGSNPVVIASSLGEGMRLPDFQMVNQSDGVPVFAHHRFTCDGRFRILVFAGNISKSCSRTRLDKLGDLLSAPLFQTTGIEIVTIHSSKRGDVELMDLHPAFRPWNEEEGWDYWKVYADDESYHHGHGYVYNKCGINQENGGLVVLRPDGYISLICALEEVTVLAEFLAGLQKVDVPRSGKATNGETRVTASL
jgi:phenol 2-monooxygenase